MAITKNAARHANRVREPQHVRVGHGPVVGPGMGHAPPPPPPRGPYSSHGGFAPGGGGHHMLHGGDGMNPGLHNGWRNGHGNHPIGPVERPPLPVFGNQGQGGQPGGWQGLDSLFQMLQGGGVNANQLANLGKGYTGGNGYAVGHAHGAFSGLSPYAAHWLATSGILQQAAPHLQDTTGLTGDALFSANMMNNLAQSQAGSGPYTLHSGITQDMLAQMLGMTQGGGYANGYNAQGRLNPITKQPFAQGGFVPPGPR